MWETRSRNASPDEDADDARYAGEVDEDEEDDPELGHHPLHISEVSPALRAALASAPVGLTGMRSVRAIGPEGQRFSAGLYGDHVFLLELPWPNPRNECHALRREPEGVQWQAYSSGTRDV